MNNSQILLLAGLILALGLTLWIREALARARRNKLRDQTRTLETLLLPKETVKLICPNRFGRWILTSKRLVIQERSGYTALPFRRIQKLQGHTADGKSTAAPAKMVSLTVKADREFTLYNHDEAFADFVKQLKAKTVKKKKKTGKKKYIQPTGSI